jgi:hypothetical protein
VIITQIPEHFTTSKVKSRVHYAIIPDLSLSLAATNLLFLYGFA